MYPITHETADWLSLSQCPSVYAEADCVECEAEGISIQELVDIIGGHPTHPNSDPSHPYWDDMRYVIEVQKLRRANQVPPSDIMCVPMIWDGYDMTQMADAVHNEYPGLHQSKLIQKFMMYKIPVDTTIIPDTSHVEFIKGICMLAYMNTWSVSHVGAINFVMKYHVGRVRPEEVAWKIATGELTTADGVPEDIADSIMDMNLSSQFDFTAYEEGSPMHPSWPAMHSAASSSSLWMGVVLDLTEDELCEAKKVDYAVSFARTMAGVHYATDNIAGLTLGQELIARALPDHLRKKYGSDPEVVQDKIDKLRFSWADFPNSDCAKSAQATVETLLASRNQAA
jgi:membrane-associated phospholipid phosphatase